MKKAVITSIKFTGFFLGWAIAVSVLPLPASENPAIWRLWAEILPLLAIIAFTIAFWLMERGQIKLCLLDNWARGTALGAAAGSVWLAAPVFVMCLTGTLHFDGRRSIPLFAVWTLAAFLNVVMQELLVRGYLYQMLKQRHNAAAAAIATTALFTALHGGALAAFLKVNHTAKVYIQRRAFEKHFSKSLGFVKVPVGLDRKLMDHPQVVLVDGEYRIDEELLLFTVRDTSRFYSTANDTLYDEQGRDGFAHEQNLMIFGERNLLVMGCGHCGVVNILERAKEYGPKVCIGGYHLMVPVTKRSVPEDILAGIAGDLAGYDMDFYTCHCTGEEAFRYLAERVARMRYLACGDTIEL